MDHRPTRVDPRLSRAITPAEYAQYIAQQEPPKSTDVDHSDAYPMPPHMPRGRLQRPSSTGDDHALSLPEHDERPSRPHSFYVPPPPLISRIPSQDSDTFSPTTSGAAASGDTVRPIRSRSSSTSSTQELSPSQQGDSDHRSRSSHISSQPAHRSKLSKQYTPSDSEESSEGEDQEEDDDDDDKSDEDDSDDEPVMITQARRSRLLSGQHVALNNPLECHVSLAKRISKLFGSRKASSSSSSSTSSESSNTKPSSLMSASVSTLSLSSTTQAALECNTQPNISVNAGSESTKKASHRMSVMSLDNPPPAQQVHRMSMLPQHQRATTAPETSTPTLLQQMHQKQQQSSLPPTQFHAGYQISPKLLPVTGVAKTRDSGFSEPEEVVQHRRYRSSSNDPSMTTHAHHRLSMAMPSTMNNMANQRNSVIMLDEPPRWQAQQRSNSMPFAENELKRMSVFGSLELAPQTTEHSTERRSSTPTPGPKPLISRLERPNHSVCFQEISNKPREVSNQAVDPKISQLAQQHRKDFKRMHHQQHQMQLQLQVPQETMEVLQPSPVGGAQNDFLLMGENMRSAGHRRESTSSQYYYVPQHLQYHQVGTPARRSSGDSLTQVSMGGVPVPTHTLVQTAAGQPAMVVPILPTKNPHRGSISQQGGNGMLLTTLPTPLSTPVPIRPGATASGSTGHTPTGYFGLPTAPGTPMQMSPFSSPSLGAVATNSAADLSLANDLAQQQLHQIRLQQQQLLLQQQQQQLQLQLQETTQALALSRAAAAQSAMASNVTNTHSPAEVVNNEAVSPADDKPLMQHHYQHQQQQQQQHAPAAMYYPAPLLTPMLNMGVAANGMGVLPSGGPLFAAASSAMSPPLLASPPMTTLVGYQSV
ncbi:hypothetical protein BGZ73_002935 [Actinomortierella ambigua]|nr:hypothetical protein BGZ73_002935 [Actinomortierella ambigua]